MNKLPLARSKDILVQHAGKEILIYDVNSHKAYCLNETLAVIYQACDGRTTFGELRVENNFTDDIILLALDGLEKENLLERGEEFVSPFDDLSRREVIKKIGLASTIALPVIASLIAPSAVDAQSACRTLAQPCVGSGQGNCCSGLFCEAGLCF